jgi:multidrug transporter EmrE-like cation transporter
MLFLKRIFSQRWIVFLCRLVAFELIADLLAKQFAVSGKLFFATLAMFGFIATNIAWLTSLRTGAQLGRGAVLFSVFTGIGAVLIGLLVYKEKANRYQLIGLLLGIAAIAFLSVE